MGLDSDVNWYVGGDILRHGNHTVLGAWLLLRTDRYVCFFSCLNISEIRGPLSGFLRTGTQYCIWRDPGDSCSYWMSNGQSAGSNNCSTCWLRRRYSANACYGQTHWTDFCNWRTWKENEGIVSSQKCPFLLPSCRELPYTSCVLLLARRLYTGVYDKYHIGRLEDRHTHPSPYLVFRLSLLPKAELPVLIPQAFFWAFAYLQPNDGN